MQVLNPRSFLDSLSEPRVKSYQNFFYPAVGARTPTDDELAYIYLWNAEVSEIFWKVISLIEIAMRNSMHKELSSMFFTSPKKIASSGVRRNQLIGSLVNTSTVGNEKSCNWYHAINFSLEPLCQITKRTHSIRPGGIYNLKSYTVTPDDVISGLTFGFWRFLFKNISSAGVDHKPLISSIFRYSPFYGQKITAAVDFKVDCRLDMIHEFRNRISHHEPVWKLKHMLEEKQTRDGNGNVIVKVDKSKPRNKSEMFDHLITYYNRMMEFLFWLDKDTAKSFRASWWNDRLLFLFSERGIGCFIDSYSEECHLSKSLFKRDVRKILSNGRMRIVYDKSRKGVFIPL